MDTKFYKVVRPFISFVIKLLFHPKVIGVNNIPKTGRVVLAGNHTKWLDPVALVAIQKRQIHLILKFLNAWVMPLKANISKKVLVV